MTATNPAGLTPKQAARRDLQHANDHLDAIAEAARGTAHGETTHALVHAVAHLRDAVAVLIREMPDDD